MTTQNALEAIGVSVDGVSKETLVAIVRRLQAENERLRENAKTISELEQLAARSNNDLLVENERLRKDADVGSAIQRAAAELPRGYILGISVEADAATVDLGLPTGHIKHMDVDDENRLAAEINTAIDTAKRRCEACAILPCSCK